MSRPKKNEVGAEAPGAATSVLDEVRRLEGEAERRKLQELRQAAAVYAWAVLSVAAHPAARLAPEMQAIVDALPAERAQSVLDALKVLGRSWADLDADQTTLKRAIELATDPTYDVKAQQQHYSAMSAEYDRLVVQARERAQQAQEALTDLERRSADDFHAMLNHMERIREDGSLGAEKIRRLQRVRSLGIVIGQDESDDEEEAAAGDE
jgi:hypothetical protein